MVVSIVSLKGGVGKSTVSMNIGDLLSDYAKTIIIDTDQQNSVASLLCKRFEKGFSELIINEASLSEVIKKAFDDGNLYFIPTGTYAIEHPIEFEAAFREDKLKDIFNALGEFEYIIIDTPPRISKHVETLLKISDYCLVVISPDPASVASLKIFLDYLKKEGLENRYSIIVNNLEPTEISEDIYTFIQAISKGNILGALPKDINVLEAEANCTTVRRYNESSAFVFSLKNIVSKLLDILKG
jgi:cellulose biosynthesis protein BcsQ